MYTVLFVRWSFVDGNGSLWFCEHQLKHSSFFQIPINVCVLLFLHSFCKCSFGRALFIATSLSEPPSIGNVSDHYTALCHSTTVNSLLLIVGYIASYLFQLVLYTLKSPIRVRKIRHRFVVNCNTWVQVVLVDCYKVHALNSIIRLPLNNVDITERI